MKDLIFIAIRWDGVYPQEALVFLSPEARRNFLRMDGGRVVEGGWTAVDADEAWLFLSDIPQEIWHPALMKINGEYQRVMHIPVPKE